MFATIRDGEGQVQKTQQTKNTSRMGRVERPLNEEAGAEFKKKVIEKGDAKTKLSLEGIQKTDGGRVEINKFNHNNNEESAGKEGSRRSQAPWKSCSF